MLPVSIIVILAILVGAAAADEALSPVDRQELLFVMYQAQLRACSEKVPDPHGVSRDEMKRAVEDAMGCLRPVHSDVQRRLSEIRKMTTEQAMLAALSARGYAVIGRSNVNLNHFTGCDLGFGGGMFPLEDGDVFACDPNAPSSAWSSPWPGLEHPRVVILKQVSSGSIRLLVDGVIQDGTLIRPH